ncbi:uncharacterized [Tachysurus ichikawai]
MIVFLRGLFRRNIKLQCRRDPLTSAAPPTLPPPAPLCRNHPLSVRTRPREQRLNHQRAHRYRGEEDEHFLFYSTC